MKQKDAQLVKEVLRGNTAFFGVLVRKYQGVVYGLAYHLVKDFSDAEDITQEAFLQAYLNLPQLRDPARFAGWLRRITCNICNMWTRSQRAACVSLETATENGDTRVIPAPDGTDPASETERKELCDAVLKAINSLSEKNRLAVMLFYMDGLSYKQIGEFLEVPVTTIESRLHKARRQLKEKMTQMIEQDFGKKKLGPEFATKVVQGALEIVTDPPVYGFIRQGKGRKDDVYVSPSQIRKFSLKTGDVIKCETRPSKEDKGEHYDAALYIYTVNGKDPRTGEIPKAFEPRTGTKVVEGVLELVPHLYGHIRQENENVYVGPSQIRNFGLKTGTIIKGKARSPKGGSEEQSYVLVHIDEVDDKDPKTA